MQCGTKPDMNGKFYENNIVIQYDKDLIEVWDEAKRLRCEWYNDYEKGITKPPIRVSDLEVVELNFRGKFSAIWVAKTAVLSRLFCRRQRGLLDGDPARKGTLGQPRDWHCAPGYNSHHGGGDQWQARYVCWSGVGVDMCFVCFVWGEDVPWHKVKTLSE